MGTFKEQLREFHNTIFLTSKSIYEKKSIRQCQRVKVSGSVQAITIGELMMDELKIQQMDSQKVQGMRVSEHNTKRQHLPYNN